MSHNIVSQGFSINKTLMVLADLELKPSLCANFEEQYCILRMSDKVFQQNASSADTEL
jgi:hypothetical protein